MASWTWILTKRGRKLHSMAKRLGKLEIRVGFPEGSGTYEDGTSIAQIAAYNEFGTKGIPARPFLRTSFNEQNREKISQFLSKQVQQAIAGEDLDPETIMERTGVFAKGLVQQNIVEGDWAPNAPSTIRKKGSAQPLIDTGTMRQSVQYVVRKRK